MGRLVIANEDSLLLAVEELNRGAPVIFPTDTVYGLGAHAFMEAAVCRIYHVKGRPPEKPIALLLADPKDVPSVAREASGLAQRLVRHFFPGDLTLVFLRAPTVPDWVTRGGDTVAVRVPDHPFARSLIRAAGAPLATTSANLAGQPSPTTAQEAYAQLGQRVSLVLDGGTCPVGRESTVLDISGPVPRLLRRGAIELDRLRRVCGQVLDVVE